MLSKVAAYGFLRVVLPLFPDAAADFQLLMLLLALASILYGSVLAFTQTDARLILGYSSVAQLGFITLGIFALEPEGRGAQGAMLQMVNHGLVVAPLFLIVVLLAARAGGSEDLRDMGGIAFRAPVLAALFLIVALATLAMPGSANFVGEFFILLGLFGTKLVDRDPRLHRRRAGVRLHAADLHPHDAQPASGRRVESRDLSRRATGSCSRRSCAVDPRLRALPAAGAGAAAERDVGAPSAGGQQARDRARRWRRDEGPDDRLGGALAARRADRRRLPRAAGRACCAPRFVRTRARARC